MDGRDTSGNRAGHYGQSRGVNPAGVGRLTPSMFVLRRRFSLAERTGVLEREHSQKPCQR